MKTVKSFCEKSNLDASLIRAVIRQIGGWQEFKDHTQDVSNHGADGGFSGFIYYSDTVPFAKRNKAAIIAYAEDMAKDIGSANIIDFLAGFNCLKDYNQAEIAEGLYNQRSDNKTTIFNALAWFALEEVCRSYVDLIEQ